MQDAAEEVERSVRERQYEEGVMEEEIDRFFAEVCGVTYPEYLINEGD